RRGQDRPHDVLRDPARAAARGAPVQRQGVPPARRAGRRGPVPRRGIAGACDAVGFHRQEDLPAPRGELHAGTVRHRAAMRGFDPLLAVLASGLGLAAAHAGGVPPDAIRAIAALALAAPAFLGFRRTVGRVADEAAHPAVGLVVMLVLPALFLLVLTCGTDHFVRGAWSWSAFAAGLSFALLATAVALARGFEARDADLATGRRTLATAIAPMHAKLWLFGL